MDAGKSGNMNKSKFFKQTKSRVDIKRTDMIPMGKRPGHILDGSSQGFSSRSSPKQTPQKGATTVE
jgi:hypothetical protein